MTGTDERAHVPWWDGDPARLARDRAEVSDRFPELHWVDDDAGGFDGTLPMWPFQRPAPAGLAALLDGRGLHLELRYRQAYPMVAPWIRPLDPAPAIHEWTMHAWHVNGNGTLCLLQADAMWDPTASIVDLLVNAAGWRIEYALMRAGAIDIMSLHGIVSDDSLDAAISAAGAAATADGAGDAPHD